jgi:undecaprenyl-diphosphatase
MLEYLDKLDREWLLFINSHHTPFWDTIMSRLSDRTFWIFLYVFIIVFLSWKFKKHAIVLIPSIILSIVASDIFASWIMKPLTGRLRPCWDPELKKLLHLIEGCGSQYGFLSSHASTHFALAAFLTFTLFRFYKWIPVVFIWAAVISYSRIYLGKHYPGDVISGAAAGIALAYIFYRIYSNILPRIFRENRDN